jgi:RHS repeat-associated protein
MGPGGVRGNSYTGNLFYQRTDLHLAGRMPIDISFSYNSADQGRSNGYGRGWTFGYGMQVKEKADTSTIIRNDGRKDVFIRNATSPGAFTAPKGVFDSLISTGSGKYVLRSKDGSKYFFDNASHQRITRQEDRNGNALVFSYTDSLITQIADGAGRTIQLNYNSGKLEKVIDANGSPTRTISYQYDNQGNLQKVTDPMGFTMEYAYVVNGPLNTVTDRNGNTVNLVYNANYAVKEIISCLTRQTINYIPNTNTTHVTELVGSTNQLTSYKFDANGNLIQKTGNCCGFNVQYEYDQDKNISKIIDANGKTYNYTYDGMGNLLSETDPLNHSIRYSYEPVFNKISKVTDKNGNTTSYTYDQRGNLTKVEKPLSITESYTYAANGDMASYTDGRGNTTNYTYDGYGDLTAIKRPLNSTTNYSYDSKSRKLTETDPLNHVTTYTYNDLDRITKVTDALNNNTNYTYDPNGNLTAVTDANNHTTSYGFDALDRKIKITDALGHDTKMAYDAKGNLTALTDANGNTTKYTYDEQSRLTSKTNAANETTSYGYDGNGNAISIEHPNGNKVVNTYDDVNRLIKVVDVIGPIMSYTYDNNGNKLTETDGNGNGTTYGYDGLNRQASSTDALGHALLYSYDKGNNRISYTDKNNHSATYDYDELNRLVSNTDPLGQSTLFHYDASSNLLSVTDAKNNVTSYSYDMLNRKVIEGFADGNSKSFSYDSVGNLVSLTDAKGVTVKYVYDVLNRLIKRDYPNANDDVFTYDNTGKKLTANNADATILFVYDNAGRLISETLNGKTTSYVYQISNKQRTIKYPSGRIIENKLDARDRLIDVNEEGQSISSFTYDASDRNISTHYLNGTSTIYSFDAVNRIVSALSNPGGFQNFSYGYDNEGNKLFEQRVYNPVGSEQYSYDKLNRLTEFKVGNLIGTSIPAPARYIQYNYDAVGNRTSSNDNGNIVNYIANNVNEYDQLSGITNVTPDYDNQGNLVFDGTYNFSYDPSNRITLVNNGTVAGYKYDALGRRIKKIFDSSAVNYYYSGNQFIEERNDNDSVLALYVYGSFIDQALTISKNGTSYYYHYNNLNTITSITNVLGKVVEQYKYDAYGNFSILDSGLNELNNSKIGNTFFFSGRQFDFESGKYYYRNRTYDARIGRFNQRDPIGFWGGSINLYTYLSNNPINRVDPFGTKDGSGPGSCSPQNQNQPYPPGQQVASSNNPNGWGGGISGELDVIVPGMSNGGWVIGLNIEYTPDAGLGLYVYYVPNGQGALGYSVGGNVQVNVAYGNGPWSGLFDSGSVGGAIYTGSYFQSPQSDLDQGHGYIGIGVGLQTPGFSASTTTTNYVPILGGK